VIGNAFGDSRVSTTIKEANPKKILSFIRKLSESATMLQLKDALLQGA